jgi:hypothetical protein
MFNTNDWDCCIQEQVLHYTDKDKTALHTDWILYINSLYSSYTEALANVISRSCFNLLWHKTMIKTILKISGSYGSKYEDDSIFGYSAA